MVCLLCHIKSAVLGLEVDVCYLRWQPWFLAQCLAYSKALGKFSSSEWMTTWDKLKADLELWQKTIAYLLIEPKCLNLAVPPLLSGKNIQTVEEGSSVNVVCNVKSNPQAQMMWYKNGSILNLEKNHHQVQQTSESLQLSISKVKKSDNGTYSCVAHSSLQRETKDFHLFVKGNSLLKQYLAQSKTQNRCSVNIFHHNKWWWQLWLVDRIFYGEK